MSKSANKMGAKIAAEVFFGLGILVLSLLSLTVFWVIDTWKSISFGEIVLQLSSPIEGTSSDIINMFYLRCLLPAVLIAIVFTAAGIIFRKRGIKVALLHMISLILAVVILAISLVCFDKQFGALDYLKSINVESEFIETNYVDPAEVSITFPEQKRNLIYIYLESMEMTYADKDNGGFLDENCIPELTELAEKGDCFAGSTGKLNGAKPLFGTQYTMGGMLAQSAGLPMFGNLGNTAEYQDEFYPGATTLGDILAANGYRQELMVGSEAEFGGRAKYFTQHGGYEIFDLFTARERGYIPEDYLVWWGFEDEKLFDYAKTEVLALAESGEPFNFTMLTADTHFPNGFVCGQCDNEFDMQYKNVVACSSKQTYEFIEWIKEQDFYENTTIVICGDHLTMDSDFSNLVSSDYDRRTYVAIINSAATDSSDEMRVYSTIDLFPTTLAAMGCKMDSDRLALGTNLYSKTATLLEDFDMNYVNRELAKDSPFVEAAIASWDKYNLQSLEYNCELCLATEQVDGDPEYFLVSISGIELFGDTDKKIYAVLYGPDGSELGRKRMDRGDDLWFKTGFEADLFTPDVPQLLEIEVIDDEGISHKIVSRTVSWRSDMATLHSDINGYIEWLSTLDDVSVFIAIADEGTWNMSDSTVGMLRDLLSLSADLYMRCSYCAVIDDGEVVFEQTSPDAAVSCEGSLSDGSEYSALSASFAVGCTCSVVINGAEYAPVSRGLNFVVYDNKTGVVTDTCVFDTYETNCLLNDMDFWEYEDIDFEYDEFTKDLDISVTLDPEQSYSNSILFIWDDETLDAPIKVDMEDTITDDGRVCSATVNISGLDPDSLYCSVYIRNDAVIARYRAKVFD